jgi:arsenate reductase
MAAAWFNTLADAAKATATSAGTEPGASVHPEVIEAMREVGIDLARAQPQRLTVGMIAGAQHLITMGCGEACPVAPSWVKRDDWPLEDPKGKSIVQVRAIRDEIRQRVEAFIHIECWDQ